MFRISFKSIFTIIIVALIFMSSCSTTRVLSDNEYRLRENKVIIENKSEYPRYKITDIYPYIRQKPNSYLIGSWNPFIYIYNWGGEKDNGWNRFVKKVGNEPIVYDPLLVENSNNNILTHLKYLGYYNSSIVDSISTTRQLADVIYKIHLGKQYPISKIIYKIKDSLLNKIYMKDSLDILIKIGDPLSEDVLEKESQRAVSLFRNNGYFGFSKDFFFFDADTLTKKDSAILTMRIENYGRSESVAKARPHKQYHIRKVEVNPVSDITRYRAALLLNKNLKLDTLNYGDISILYDKKIIIRPNVLNNLNKIKTGDLYSENLINNTYNRYSNIGLFNSVNVNMNEVPDTSLVDCFVRLIPSKTQGYKLNLEASTNSTGLIGISPEITYFHKNIFHGGEWLDLSLMGNFQFKNNSDIHSNELGVSSSISVPSFLFLKDSWFGKIIPRTDFSASYNYQSRPEYVRNIISSSFGYSWYNSSHDFYFKLLPLQASIVRIFNMSDDFYETLKDPFLKESYKNHFDFGSGITINYNTAKSINPQVSHFKSSLTFDIAGNVLSLFDGLFKNDSDGNDLIWGSPYSQYVRAELKMSKTWKFGRNNKYALAIRGLGGYGYAYGNSSSMPFERLFWAGGANGLRGWQARSVGPGTMSKDTTFSIPNQTGDIKLESNIEYRFPIVNVLNGAFFVDAGNVWTRNESVAVKGQTGDGQFHFSDFYKELAVDSGFGLRIDIQYIVLRLDLGIKIHDPSKGWRSANKWFKDDGYALQFGIGYPF